MKKGRASTGSGCASPSQAGVAVGRGGLGSSLYRLLAGGQGRLEFAPVAQLLKDRQAARGSVAPLGAKGWSRLSMCQIASESRRARSIWATLAPRCLLEAVVEEVLAEGVGDGYAASARAALGVD